MAHPSTSTWNWFSDHPYEPVRNAGSLHRDSSHETCAIFQHEHQIQCNRDPSRAKQVGPQFAFAFATLCELVDINPCLMDNHRAAPHNSWNIPHPIQWNIGRFKDIPITCWWYPKPDRLCLPPVCLPPWTIMYQVYPQTVHDQNILQWSKPPWDWPICNLFSWNIS
jgi:hypothetical protein